MVGSRSIVEVCAETCKLLLVIVASVHKMDLYTIRFGLSSSSFSLHSCCFESECVRVCIVHGCLNVVAKCKIGFDLPDAFEIYNTACRHPHTWSTIHNPRRRHRIPSSANQHQSADAWIRNYIIVALDFRLNYSFALKTRLSTHEKLRTCTLHIHECSEKRGHRFVCCRNFVCLHVFIKWSSF